MNKYVKIRLFDKTLPEYLHYVDENYRWSEEQVKSENGKAVTIAKMAFLDHGSPLIPMDELPAVMEQKAAYLTPQAGVVFLIYQGGNYLTMTPDVEIVEEIYSNYFPISVGAAIICENDPFDKNRGGLDYHFKKMAQMGGAESFHFMFSFSNRLESEIIEAFKNTPAILFYSSHRDVWWFELMLRCIIKSKTKAKIVGKKPYYDKLHVERFNRCVAMAKVFDINIIEA